MRSRLPTVIWQAAEKAKEDVTPRVPIIPPTQWLVLEFGHFLSQIPPTQLVRLHLNTCASSTLSAGC